MSVTLEDHILSGDIESSEVEDIIYALQRSIPTEIFDPDALTMTITVSFKKHSLQAFYPTIVFPLFVSNIPFI